MKDNILMLMKSHTELHFDRLARFMDVVCVTSLWLGMMHHAYHIVVLSTS